MRAQQLDIFTGEVLPRSVEDILASVDLRVKGSFDRAMDEIGQHWVITDTYNSETVCMDQVWEHPSITAHNKGAHILHTYFFTLYQRRPEFDFEPVYRLILGRIGNTAVWDINPKGGQHADPQ
ncbi:MAG: hypothetical protein WC423_24860 [Vulcanimicrobiota bacterium]